MYDPFGPMRRVLCAVISTVLLAIPEIAAAARVTFDRIHPAAHDLGPADTEVALVYAIGDNESISTFLDTFLYETNHAGTLRVYDVRNARRPRPVPLSLRVTEYRCSSKERSGEGSTRDYEGNRVRRRLAWADAVCEAKMEIVRGTTAQSFRARGEGTSPRVENLTAEETSIAVDQAARYAAVAAAEEITPRRVRETITLDDTAPAFGDGESMIESGLLAQARALWEAALPRNRTSAGLRFNLAAVSEAMGDVRAAAQYFAQARELAPQERRYRVELELFNRRNHIKPEGPRKRGP